MSQDNNTADENASNGIHVVKHIDDLYQNWFLDYASYVILERAVPALEDGFKPVQRRILHAMYELEDGRYNKAANIIGHTMKYHPHGDASIGDAMVQLGQKDLLIDCQGNWGNVLTGDSAAASRYIEARLSKFGLEVVYNPKTTVWQASYDGRNPEPVNLPVKFPLLLAQGVEGIAVGLACKILPHNFNELVDASIDILRGRKTHIQPDFLTGGYADFTNYNEGLRGGKVRIRARISQIDKKTLCITEIPFSTTTGSLIDSIVAANEKEKIKIRKIEDNTAEHVEIILHLHPGVSPDKMIDALYAFTDCEISISPNACVIDKDKPKFIGVNELLRLSTDHTVHLLRSELEIKQGELREAWHFASLEKIFIEKRIYRDIEEAETWEAVISKIDKGLQPYRKLFRRQITNDDIIRLTEIKIKRISKFDSFKADEHIRNLENELTSVQNHLDHLTDYAIEYFKNIKKKYGKGRERKTEIKTFENIVASSVAVANAKLYVNREEGFVGYGIKKDEYVSECSDIDEVIVFKNDGTMSVIKIAEKSFVGKGIIHVSVFKKNDERTIYNLVYRDGPKGSTFMKRFAVNGVTRDKNYQLTKGTPGSEILYFSANPNGEAEIVTVFHKPLPGLRKTQFDIDFSQLAIKGRNTLGNLVTKFPVRKITIKEKGLSTLGARMIWYDDVVNRLNTDSRGKYLGEFSGDDKIICITQSGHYRLCSFDLSNHFDDDTIIIQKWIPDRAISAVYFDGEKKEYYAKRFLAEPTEKKMLFISESEGSVLELASLAAQPVFELVFPQKKDKAVAPKTLSLNEFIGIKGMKAKGNKVTADKIKEVNDISPPDVSVPESTTTTSEEQDSSEKLNHLRRIRAHLDDMEKQTKLDLE